MQEKIRMVAFDQEDWYGLAGAEAAPDGTQPHLNVNDFPITVDGVAAFVVADNNGVEITVSLTVEIDTVWQLRVEQGIHLALLIAQALPCTMQAPMLAKLGFKQISGADEDRE